MQLPTQLPLAGRNTLLFGSNRISSHRYFEKDSSLLCYQPAEKNLIAGRMLAKGGEKRRPNPTRAMIFFNQAMTARNKKMAQHVTLAIAELLHDGYYSIEKNDDKALELLKEARAKAERVKDENRRHWEIVQIGRQILLNHSHQLSRKEQSGIIMDLIAATRIRTTDPFLAHQVAMTFARIGAKPELIRDAVKVSLRNADAWNREDDKENPDRPSRACFFDEETLQYARNFALGLEGFPQDQEYARELLLTRAKSYMTPNPIAHLAMARIAHEDLGDKKLATEILNIALDKAKYKPLTSAAGIFASLGNTEKARELLEQAEAKIEPDQRNEALI